MNKYPSDGDLDDGYDHQSIALAIGQRLARRRRLLGLNTQEVASRIQRTPDEIALNKNPIDRRSLYSYEAGIYIPSIYLLVRLSIVLKTNPHWLAFGVGVEDVSNPLPDAQPIDGNSTIIAGSQRHLLASFGSRFARQRRLRGLSLMQVVDQMSLFSDTPITESTLGRLESGKANLKLDFLSSLAKFYNAPPWSLLFGDAVDGSDLFELAVIDDSTARNDSGRPAAVAGIAAFVGAKVRRQALAPAVGARLRERREALGLSIQQVVDRITPTAKEIALNKRPLARSSLSQYENGVVLPSLDILLRLAPVIDSSPSWLLFGEGQEVDASHRGARSLVLTDGDGEDWVIPRRYLERSLPGVSSEKISVLTAEPGVTVGIEDGEALVFALGVGPTSEWNEMVFVRENQVYSGLVRKVGTLYEVRVPHIDLNAQYSHLDILGMVVGYISFPQDIPLKQ